MAYASASDVSAFCQNLLNSEDNFTSSTCPTLTEVNVFLSSGCSIIETTLASKGYSIPVLSSATAYDWIKQLNTFYAVAQAEMSRTNVITGPGERTRSQQFSTMFESGLDRLVQMDLTVMGVTRSEAGVMYAGGTKVSEKEDWDADTDRVKPRFRRGQFASPGTLRSDEVAYDYSSDEAS